MRYINLDRFNADGDEDTISDGLGFPTLDSMFDSAASAWGTFIADDYTLIWDNYSDDEIIALWYTCFTLIDHGKKGYLSLLLIATNNVGFCKGAAANGFATLPMLLKHIPKKLFTQLVESYKETVGA